MYKHSSLSSSEVICVQNSLRTWIERLGNFESCIIFTVLPCGSRMELNVSEGMSKKTSLFTNTDMGIPVQGITDCQLAEGTSVLRHLLTGRNVAWTHQNTASSKCATFHTPTVNVSAFKSFSPSAPFNKKTILEPDPEDKRVSSRADTPLTDSGRHQMPESSNELNLKH